MVVNHHHHKGIIFIPIPMRRIITRWFTYKNNSQFFRFYLKQIISFLFYRNYTHSYSYYTTFQGFKNQISSGCRPFPISGQDPLRLIVL